MVDNDDLIDKIPQSQLREVERFRAAHRHIVSTFWNQFVSLIIMIMIMIMTMTVTYNDDEDNDYNDYDLSSHCLGISC